jgi:3,4-dihydroxy 2-butanone 4-phosphate synthase/GTP cyclohydrolase II
MIAYESKVNGGESHIALVKGDLLCAAEPAFSGIDGGLPSAGAVDLPTPILVRVHTRCTAGDVFAADCNCREILDQSMRIIAEEGCGVLLYLHNASRGFTIEQPALDRPESDRFDPAGAAATLANSPAGKIILHKENRAREGSQARTGRILRAIGLGGQILSDLGIQRIRLLSNTPMHIPALEGFGLEIVEQVPIPVEECSRVG